MRWRSRARYSAYSAGDPPLPGETPPDDPPPGEAPGVASASLWPGRATTPAPPSPPLAVVVDSSARPECPAPTGDAPGEAAVSGDGKSTRLNSSHVAISYAVFCLKKKELTNHHKALPAWIITHQPPA